ncbi:hypothetical protein Daus18300_003555 [Diaporthe australafricana]|uniref:Uncharacterized protein n=1 Tax=Diaporthe australafricana TaxID=127596 RepID=A0ABR3XEZ7_9PEZI
MNALRLNNDRRDDLPVESGGKHGKTRRGTKSRLRMHKIGVHGDDWALAHGKREGEPRTEHVQLELSGLKPFGDRNYQDQRNIDNAEWSARYLRRGASKRPDAPREAEVAGDYYFRSLQIHHENPGEVKRARDPRGPRLHGDAPNEVAKKYRPPQRVSKRQERPRKAHQEATLTSSNVDKDTLPEQLSQETLDATDRKANLGTDELQDTTSDELRGQDSDGPLPRADRPQRAMAPEAGLDSWTEMSPIAKEAITRQHHLAASETKPLFSPRPLEQHGEFSVAAADVGPAESLQESLLGDPVLMKAKSLARMGISLPLSLPMPSRLETHTEPRFHLVFDRKPVSAKLPKNLWPSEDKSKALQGHMNKLQIRGEIKPQAEQHHKSPVQISGSRLGQPEAVASEGGRSTDVIELKALKDTQDAPGPQGETEGAGHQGTGLAKPVQATDNRSIFEKLFAEQERTKGTDYGQLAPKLRSAYSAGETGHSDAKSRQVMPAEMTPRQGLSIFGQLFPEEVESVTVNNEQDTPRAPRELPQLPEDSVMVSLRNEVRNWISEDRKHQISGPQHPDYGSHSTVVVISGTSPSLIDTDFYRIAPEGQHVEGWAGGLLKVIQARDSISHEPLGQYYLMFHSRPSALAYVDEVRRLHGLSRKLLHAPADSGRQVAKGPLDQAPTTPQPFLTNEEKAAVRSFTLYSPNITPNISVRMWNTKLVAELAAKSTIADILPTLRPEGSTPARVLLKLTSPDGKHGEGRGGLTTDELWLTLRDDGRERSAPWVLVNLSEGIMPVKPRFISEHYKITVRAEPVPVPLELDDQDVLDGHGGESVVGPLPPKDGGEKDSLAAGVDRSERFNRFVLTFTQPAIARRFVRCWHKRVVYDGMLERSVVVDAVAIM